MPSRRTHAVHRLLSLLLAGCALFSLCTLLTLAWKDFNQHKINWFTAGDKVECSVVLTKHENGKDGKSGNPDVRVPGAVFLLYRINDDATETQIGTPFTTNSDGQLVAHSLPPGNYVLVETNPPHGYRFVEDSNGDPITRHPFTLGENGQLNIEIEANNLRALNGLTLTKTVQNESGLPLTPAQMALEFTFTVHFSEGGPYNCTIDGGTAFAVASGDSLNLKHGQKAVFTDIPVGVQYTLAETPQPGYETTSENSQGHVVEPGTEAKFSNIWKDKAGSLRIVKTIGGSLALPEDDFAFTVTFEDGGSYDYTVQDSGGSATGGGTLASGGTLTLKGGETALFPLLPLGLGFTVTEDTTSLPSGYLPTVETVSGQALESGAVAHFYNHNEVPSADAGHLRIEKTLAGGSADAAKDFTFTVTFSDGGSYDCAIDGGAPFAVASGGSFALKGGETALFENLPSGIAYTVEETDYSGDGYLTAPKSAQGTIVPNVTAAFVCVNEKNEPDPGGTATLTVTKKVAGPVTDKKFDITVKLKHAGSGLDEEHQIKLSSGESISYDDLPHGTAYEVTEADYYPDGYMETTTLASGVLQGNTAVDAVITNTWYGPEMIIIQGQKQWDTAANPGITLPDFITVNLKDGDVLIATQKVTPNAQNEWHYRFEVPKYKPDGTTEILYTVEEEAVYSFKTEVGPLTPTADPAVFQCDITNTAFAPLVRDGLKAKKTVEGDNIPADSVFEFTLTALDGAPAPVGAVSGVETIAVTGSGEVSFGSLTFVHPGVYRYTVREKDGGLAGYTYDTSIYTAAFTVENRAGTLEVTDFTLDKDGTAIDPVPDSLAFVNQYAEVVPISISVQKVIVASGDIPHPAQVQVQLYRSGQPVGPPVTLNEANQWRHTWPGLDAKGEWTVDEADVPAGYTKEITGDAQQGFTVTNRASSRKDIFVLHGQKSWEHHGNPEQNRPKAITVVVKQGGFVAAQKQVTEQDGWRYSFELPKYDRDGNEIQYTVEELPVEGYAAKVDGTNITNTFITSDSAQTNDPTRLWLWGSAFLVSAGGLLALLALRRHKKRKRRIEELRQKLNLWRKSPGIKR